MLQIVQDLRSGETILEEVPVPHLGKGQVLIKTKTSLVSLGTEKMLVEFSQANFLNKARQQPEKVRQVVDKIKSDGIRPTLEAVFRKLGEPLPLGYCNAGEVLAVGEGVTEFLVGDRVVSNGPHAEIVCISKNLVAKIPDGVSYAEACFTVVGAIALQGIRLIQPALGETVVVTGLGLIGLIAAQLLVANGCRVIGLDFDQAKVDLAISWGIAAIKVTENINPVSFVLEQTQGVGADAVLITASSKSNAVISQAAQISRKRGRIVLVGVIGLDLQRSDFYEKELTFQVSCSYGPGRYDPVYEQQGNDYPIGYVRWTAKRNFETLLQALVRHQLQVQPLITEVVPLNNYHQIYGNLSNRQVIASILEYTGTAHPEQTSIALLAKNFQGHKGVIGIIGAGNFTSSIIMPILSKLRANIKYIASSKGLSGSTLAKKYGIAHTTTNYLDILRDPDIDTVIITTRHNQHAAQVIKALEAGKHVFVEKPLALSLEDIDQIASLYTQNQGSLTVGFNRRFSPFIQDAKLQLGPSSRPIAVIATMNAGFIPADHWTQDMVTGGGRIIGEACHLIDLITCLTGSLVKRVVMSSMGLYPHLNTDNASILLNYHDGSQGMINYLANGSKAYSKERIEIYSQGRTIIIDNFRKAKYYGYKSSGLSKSQDKGHTEQFRRFIAHIQTGGAQIIPIADILNTSRAAIAAVHSLHTGTWVNVE